MYQMNIIVKLTLVLITLTTFASSAFSQQTAEDFYNKGLAIIKSGRYKEAIPLFDEALKLNSNYVEALLERSRARSNNQTDLKGGLADIETILQIDPRHGEAYFERAVLRNAMILEMLKEKGSMSSEEILPFNQAVLEDLDAAIANGFKNKRSYTYRAETQAREFDNQDEAIKDYTEALKYDREETYLLINRSHAKRKNGDSQGAIDDLQEVVRRYDEAKTNSQTPAQKLGTLKGAAIMALNNLSSSFAMEERPDLQLWSIEKSIELQPTAMAYISLARHKMIYGNLDDSIADYTKAIEMSNGKFGHYFMDRGIVYQLQGKLAEAEADFAQGKKIDKNLENYNLKYWLELAKRQREQKRVRVELPQ
jgi:tetratricopeptide (TPR) repeat protein